MPRTTNVKLRKEEKIFSHTSSHELELLLFANQFFFTDIILVYPPKHNGAGIRVISRRMPMIFVQLCHVAADNEYIH